MTIQLRWLVEGRIVLKVMPPRTTVAIYMAAEEPLIREYLDKGTHDVVHMLIDARQAVEVPPVLSIARMPSTQHRKLGWVLSVGHPRRANRVKAEVAALAANNDLRHFATIPEAIAFLQNADPTLPDLTDFLTEGDN